MSEMEEDLPNCPYCNIDIASSSHNESALLVECLNPNCKDLVEFNEHSCESCGVGFTEEDWDLFVATAPTVVIEQIKDFYASSDPLMICCEESMMDCTCSYPVSWDDTEEVPQDIWENVYQDSFSNDCFTCSYQYTEYCKPLRNFVIHYIKNPKISAGITVCEDYYQDELVIQSLSSAATNDYIHINYEEF